ncbi:MAG: hypothetical protein KBD76_05440 [Bacteriovorax sp.]|nr:hypothetical protein [Bacteriovorax sp.]
MKYLSVALYLLFSFNSSASDSTWLLCDNGHLAANIVEHRSHDGLGRVTSINLILGMNVFNGELHDADSGHVLMPSLSMARSGFAGDVNIDYSKSTFSLKGILRLDNERFVIESELNCKEMSVDL